MSAGEPEHGAITGEIRIRTEGGVGHFPGLARERVVGLDQLPPEAAREVARLADEARFFDCPEPEPDRPQPDARTHRLCLVLGPRSRELCLREPIRDPALARLVTAVRRFAVGGERKS